MALGKQVVGHSALGVTGDSHAPIAGALLNSPGLGMSSRMEEVCLRLGGGVSRSQHCDYIPRYWGQIGLPFINNAHNKIKSFWKIS